jgi:hypothetical protein
VRISLSSNAEFELTEISSKITIFCEGFTEKNYFGYFADIINRKKTLSQIVVVLELAEGDAQRVLSSANKYYRNIKTVNKTRLSDVYLAFDCDAPTTIQNVINNALNAGYKLLISNPFFETWLLMHFEYALKAITKKETFVRLSNHLRKPYVKADPGIIREIIQNGQLEQAISNARSLESNYISHGLNIYSNIKKMNPFTSVYNIIELLMEIITKY